jgi:hypothetical protein
VHHAVVGRERDLEVLDLKERLAHDVTPLRSGPAFAEAQS